MDLTRDINPYGDSRPEHLTDVNGTLFFSARDGTHGAELWKSNGTPETTMLVKDINPSGASKPAELTNVGGTLYFSADQGTIGGRELWRSDGTKAGTTRVKDINLTGDSSPQSLAAVGTTLFFSATDGIHGRELWKTDGTEPGTVIVRDIRSGPNGSDPYLVTAFGGRVYFGATTGTYAELWSSNGTAETTKRVKTENGDRLPQPWGFGVAGDQLFFTIAYPGCAEVDAFWTTDGTPAGTRFIARDSFSIVAFGGKAYAISPFGQHSRLWTSDGTEAGTGPIKPRIHASAISVAAGKLYFVGDNETLGVSDGTAAGSESLGVPCEVCFVGLVGIGDTAYFTGDDGNLWSTDGTPDGTALAADLHASVSIGINPYSLTASGGQLYFVGDDGTHGRELWRYVP